MVDWLPQTKLMFYTPIIHRELALHAEKTTWQCDTRIKCRYMHLSYKPSVSSLCFPTMKLEMGSLYKSDNA